LASLKTYHAFSAASITACLACSSSLTAAVVTGVGIVVRRVVGSSVVGSVVLASVVAGPRTVGGAVFFTAALVAGGFALAWPPHAATASSDANVIAAAHARLELVVFTGISIESRSAWDSIVVVNSVGRGTARTERCGGFRA
jgi:hypothetical protein